MAEDSAVPEATPGAGPDLWSAIALGALIAGLGMSMLADIIAAPSAGPLPPVVPVPYAVVALLLTVSGLGVFGSGIIGLARRSAVPEFRLPSRARIARVAALIAALAAFPLLMPVVGFPVSMAVLCAGAGLVYAPQNRPVVISAGALMALALHVVATQVLGVDLSWATERP